MATNKNLKMVAEEDDDDIRITNGNSSLAEFIKRPLPSAAEAEKFDRYVKEEAHEEMAGEKEVEIENSLNEIYHDEKGQIVDVKKMEKMRRHGFIFWLLTVVIVTGVLAGGVYAGYFYWYKNLGSDAAAVNFSFDAKNEVMAGEEFFYTISYENLSKVALRQAQADVKYPDHFIYLDSTPAPLPEKNNSWAVGDIAAGFQGKIKIKGKIIAPRGENSIIFANMSYMPANFSSEFKKEASFSTLVKDIGLEFSFDNIANALVGEENEIKVNYNTLSNNYINNFRLSFVPQDNIVLVASKLSAGQTTPAASGSPAQVVLIRPGVWQINTVTEQMATLPIKFKFSKKAADRQEIVLEFEQAGPGGTYYNFLEQKLPYEVMKNDLNLSLIINGSRDNQGINFGGTLHYSIVYNNTGETDMSDVVIMAVLQSDWLDWGTLDDPLKGKQTGNTIAWTKEQLPDLALIKKHQESTIDYSVKMADLTVIDPAKDYAVTSYAQFRVGSAPSETATSSENRSNTIVNKINSDLSLTEKILYFNADNIPVGTGPQPPKAGQATSYKVYWHIANSLHELSDLKVVTKLPDYVNWGDKKQSSTGSLDYNAVTREVTWQIGRLPITVISADAEWSLNFTPQEADRNKMMVVLTGSMISAIDSATLVAISETSKAKTTKLEDDDIATGDGIVE